MTADVAAFMAARLDEAEAVAKAATSGPWRWQQSGDETAWTDQGPWLKSETATWTSSDGHGPYPTTVIGAWGHDAWGVSIEDADAAHILLNDPATVLRSISADRLLLAEYERIAESARRYPNAANAASLVTAQTVVRCRAMAWDTHADYRQEWAP